MSNTAPTSATCMYRLEELIFAGMTSWSPDWDKVRHQHPGSVTRVNKGEHMGETDAQETVAIEEVAQGKRGFG